MLTTLRLTVDPRTKGAYFAKTCFLAGGLFERGAYSRMGAYLAAAKNITRVKFLVLFKAGQCV